MSIVFFYKPERSDDARFENLVIASLLLIASGCGSKSSNRHESSNKTTNNEIEKSAKDSDGFKPSHQIIKKYPSTLARIHRNIDEAVESDKRSAQQLSKILPKAFEISLAENKERIQHLESDVLRMEKRFKFLEKEFESTTIKPSKSAAPAQLETTVITMSNKLRLSNWSISPSGKTALVWGLEPGSSRLRAIVVNTTTLKKVAEHEFQFGNAQFCNDDSSIWMIRNNEIRQFNLTTFKELGKQHVDGISGAMPQLRWNPKGQIVLTQKNKMRQDSIVVVQVLDPVSLRSGSNTSSELFAEDDLAHFNSKEQRVVGLTRPVPGWPVIKTRMHPYSRFDVSGYFSSFRNYRRTGKWGRYFMSGTLFGSDFMNQLRKTTSTALIHPTYPLLVCHQHRSAKGKQLLNQVSIEFYDLTAAKKLGSFNWYLQGPPLQLGRIGVFGDNLYSADGDKFYRAKIPTEIIQKAKVPFFLTYDGPAIINLDEKTKVTIGSSVEAKLEFQLFKQCRHVSINPSTGVISIDGPAILKEIQQDLENPTRENASLDISLGLGRAPGKLRSALGISKNQLPINLPLFVEATNERRQTEKLGINLVCVLNPNTLKKEEFEKFDNELKQFRVSYEFRRVNKTKREKQVQKINSLADQISNIESEISSRTKSLNELDRYLMTGEYLERLPRFGNQQISRDQFLQRINDNMQSFKDRLNLVSDLVPSARKSGGKGTLPERLKALAVRVEVCRSRINILVAKRSLYHFKK